jgi:hypothetical protein
MMNVRRRHDTLLRRYLTLIRERDEAQIGGASPARIERLAVRERALAAALRSIRLYIGLPDTFDPELESARLGLEGKRAGRNIPGTKVLSRERSEQELRPRIRPVPSSARVPRHNGERPVRRDGAALAVTVSDLLVFVASHDVDPDSEIVVRRLSGGHGEVGSELVNVAFIGLTDDGRVQLDIH